MKAEDLHGSGTMRIVAIGVSHKSAPLSVLERLVLTPCDLPAALIQLSGMRAVQEAAILSTCHRTEVYMVTSDDEAKGYEPLITFLAKNRNMSPELVESFAFRLTDLAAVRHLFTVASGLDSMVVGEDQVLGQVRHALKEALSAGTAKAMLSALFRQAIRTGARVRRETGIGRHGRSISSVAVDLARRTLGGLVGRKVLVIGTGEASELVLQALVKQGASGIVVFGRTYERAAAVADRFRGRAITFEDLPTALRNVDIVISATAAPHPIIGLDLLREVMERREHRPLVVVDIAIPRDIDPRVRELPNVHLFDLEGLQEIVNERLRDSLEEVPKAERIIAQEVVKFAHWLRTRQVAPTIAQLYSRAEAIRASELQKAMRRLGRLNDREKKVLEAMTYALVKKLLHIPTVSLKQWAVREDGEALLQIARKLFGLDGAGESGSQVLGSGFLVSDARFQEMSEEERSPHA